MTTPSARAIRFRDGGPIYEGLLTGRLDPALVRQHIGVLLAIIHLHTGIRKALGYISRDSDRMMEQTVLPACRALVSSNLMKRRPGLRIVRAEIVARESTGESRRDDVVNACVDEQIVQTAAQRLKDRAAFDVLCDGVDGRLDVLIRAAAERLLRARRKQHRRQLVEALGQEPDTVERVARPDAGETDRIAHDDAMLLGTLATSPDLHLRKIPKALTRLASDPSLDDLARAVGYQDRRSFACAAPGTDSPGAGATRLARLPLTRWPSLGCAARLPAMCPPADDLDAFYLDTAVVASWTAASRASGCG